MDQDQSTTERDAKKAARKEMLDWLKGEGDFPGLARLSFDEINARMRVLVESLVDSPGCREPERKLAETLVWAFLSRTHRVFSCGGVGYLLPMVEGGAAPIAVTRDGHDFNFLLMTLGVNPGSPMRDRLGKFVGTMCAQWGTKTETRLSFHFEPSTFAAYVAADRGQLIKVTRHGLEEVPNGTDGQLFLFPENWRPLLTRPLSEVGGEIGAGSDFPKSDRLARALFPDGFLARHLFGGASFELRGMDEGQVRVLLLSYVLFLMMPGVVSERAMLQCLGPSGSGKTFLLELLGRLLTGPSFAPRPMPVDIREFENQIINEYFIAYDNVGSVPREVKDRFCQAVTGIEVVRRELFTTSQEARYRSKATVALAAITPPLPELEHQNRTITIHFAERTERGYVAKEELFKVVDRSRDDLILGLLRRMVLAMEALEAQRNYAPKVEVRLASVATFILRIARHEGWESKAKKLIAAWACEQGEVQEDDLATALTWWITGGDWKAGIQYTTSSLNDALCEVMSSHSIRPEHLSWRGIVESLGKRVSRGLRVYKEHFGLERARSKSQKTRGGWGYTFNPTEEQLAEVRGVAAEWAPAEAEVEKLRQVKMPF